MEQPEWTVRDLDPEEEIPEPDEWPEDELDPAEEEEADPAEGGEVDGTQE